MNGILIIDKPTEYTSHDVVARVRRILKTKRVGHTGTLDPFATGVMVILVGQATRLAQFLDKDEKEYTATIRFGCETDTGDRTGAPITDPLPAQEVVDILRNVDWEIVFSSFRGETDQIPPMYSAKKVEGKKLYEHARRGETIERKPVHVLISKLELTGNISADPTEVNISVACSAGTYIRTLAEDIGRSIGVGAHLAELRRTRAGRFDLSHSISLDELAGKVDPRSALLPIGLAVSHLPKFVIPDDRIAKTRSGLSTRVTAMVFANGEAARMEDEAGELVAIGVFDGAENTIRPKVVLI